MPYEFQIVIDSQRPHELADWWAETLGWAVEPQDESFIKKMIAEGHATDEDTVSHQGQLRWRDGVALRHPDELAGGGTRPRVLFQFVPEPKAVKNRLHLDLRSGSDDTEAVVAALTGRGATVLHTGSQGPHVWTTLADPEGNEFCVG
ncbi:MAG TPA: VOC family protein [Streptosporangiaceae bacterium]|nr:VOC family protein [Streptosporangiaceae bacterium]